MSHHVTACERQRQSVSCGWDLRSGGDGANEPTRPREAPAVLLPVSSAPVTLGQPHLRVFIPPSRRSGVSSSFGFCLGWIGMPQNSLEPPTPRPQDGLYWRLASKETWGHYEERMSGVLLRDQDRDTHKDDPWGRGADGRLRAKEGASGGAALPTPGPGHPASRTVAIWCLRHRLRGIVTATLAGPSSRSAPRGFSQLPHLRTPRHCPITAPGLPQPLTRAETALLADLLLLCAPTKGGVRCPVCPAQHGLQPPEGPRKTAAECW